MTQTTVLLHEPPPPADASAAAFRGFEDIFKAERAQIKENLQTEVAEHQRKRINEMIAGHITDAAWDQLIGQAQKAAERGEKQQLLLRFPSDLCTDQARAINNPPNPAWPQTLRGDAAEIYNRWHKNLRPRGFNLFARVLGFPDGKPGDVGLFLQWGE